MEKGGFRPPFSFYAANIEGIRISKLFFLINKYKFGILFFLRPDGIIKTRIIVYMAIHFD